MNEKKHSHSHHHDHVHDHGHKNDEHSHHDAHKCEDDYEKYEKLLYKEFRVLE